MGHELCMSRSATELAALYVILIFTSNQRIMRYSHLTNVKTGSCPKPHNRHDSLGILLGSVWIYSLSQLLLLMVTLKNDE